MIITAEKFQKNYSIEYYDEGGYQGIEEQELSKMLIEFAKMHVKQALKQSSENVESYVIEGLVSEVDRDSILNAYPLENIK